MNAEIYQGYYAGERIIIIDILNPNREDEILVIGVGTGVCTKGIVPLIKRYVGLDIAPCTIEVLRKHIKAPHNIELEICNKYILLHLRIAKGYLYNKINWYDKY